MKILDWHPGEDTLLKGKEIEVHEIYHSHLATQELTKSKILKNSKRQMRAKALEKALRKIGKTLKGNVLELGAGDGWCSAYILSKYYSQLAEVHTMEINPAAINQLIPKVFDVVGVKTDKSTLIHGSFNNIQVEDYYDFVVVMGAIHHSSNLFKTFTEIQKALKPGGWLIAQEPYMVDDTMNSFYINRQNKVDDFKGLTQVKNGDRSDVFFRACEYRTAAFHAGFDYRTFINPDLSLWYFKRALLRQNAGRPKNMTIYAQKPLAGLQLPTPTGWE
ncbi:MAG: class I SAM-dependent methyltransferase [Marinoscillum sp.]|uniref:class I SAM-dependent methyltransferase n=1 Tax=Marinoscillum sp. TaxID=2024838 RepID=UPI0032FB7D61